MKKFFYIAKEVISWALLVALLFTFAFAVYMNITSDRDGEGIFVLGYRPVLVLTGSMEPYMMTNGIALTKQVTDIDDLALNDVITYHVENEDGEQIRITHRIIALDGEQIYTKGDNNGVSDGFPLTIDNVEAKVVGVWNGSAWIVAKWQGSTAGKIMLISFAVGFILFYFCMKMFIKHLYEKWKASNQQPVQADAIEPVVEQPVIEPTDFSDTKKE